MARDLWRGRETLRCKSECKVVGHGCGHATQETSLFSKRSRPEAQSNRWLIQPRQLAKAALRLQATRSLDTFPLRVRLNDSRCWLIAWNKGENNHI
jgi:hypothetical protein